MSKLTRTPIYQVIKDDLRSKIDTGVLMTGQKIDGEMTLADKYGCSRLTVHRALRELADEGLLERRPRAGTLVAKRDTGGVMIRVPKVRDEIAHLGLDYQYELLQRRHAKPDPTISGLLRVPETEKMLHLVARHWAGNRVFQYEDRWINVILAPAALDVDFGDVPPHDWLLDNVAYSCIDHEITACAAGDAEAALLQITPGRPLLRVRRLTHLAVRRVTYSDLLHPGDLFSLRSETRAYSLNASNASNALAL